MLFSYWAFYFFSSYFFLFAPGKGEPALEKKVRQASRAEISASVARSAYAQKRYATALMGFSKSVSFAEKDKIDTCWINSMIGIANCYRNLNISKRSLNYLDKIQSDPRFNAFQNTFGYTKFLFAKSALLRIEGDTLQSVQLIDSLIHHSLRWINIRDTFLALPYEIKGFIYLYNNKLDSSLIYYKKALQIMQVNHLPEDKRLINIYMGLTKVYELQRDYNSMVDIITPTLEAIKKLPKKDTFLISSYYFLKVNLNLKLGKFDEALSYLAQLESFLLNNNSKLKDYLECLLAKSSIYSKLGDVERVESINLNILNSERILKIISPKNLSTIYFKLATISYDKELFNRALSYYQKSVEIGLKNNYENSPSYNGMGSCYFLLGDTVKAESYYKLAIKTRIEFHGVNTPLLAREYMSYSIFLKRIGRVKEGLGYITKALSLYKNSFPEKSRENSQAYAWLGTFYLDGNQPEKALDCFQRSIVCAMEGFGDYNFAVNPDLSGTYFGPELIEALKYKAIALDSLFRKKPGGDLEILKNEYDTYDLVLQAIHKQRTSFPELNSKLLVSGNERNTYIEAVGAAFQLFRHTGNPTYKSKAFEYAEKGRSAILLTSLKEKQAMSYGGLPDSLIDKETSYNQRIEKYQGMLVEERQKTGPDPQVIKEIENKIFLLRNEQNNLIASFERKFPQYYQLKYSDKILGVNTIQKRLGEKDALLEYAVTNRNILIFVITKNKFDIVPVSRTPAFDESVKSLNNYLREVSFISQDRDIYQEFLSSGNYLYNNLIKPVSPLIRGKELIIVPDETLSSIPFEVLLTSQADPMQEFSTLPYLIEQYPIGYAYSANLLFFNYKRQIPEKVRLAAFSPDYNMIVRGGLNEPYLRPLKFAREEAKTASEFFRGRVFDGEEATETNFKEVADKFDILHLAMHAIMDNENPMYSKLAFTREEDKKEDGFLNTYELFNMKLKARMVVLSACNTGAGTLQKGEGIMSLARGFYYAGCPDVVMTLWPVEDRMSTQLIKDFYTYLSKGMNKIEALRLAKLNLIRSSDPLRSHPFFWAGYVNIGDNSPVISIPKKKPTGMMWALTIGISILLVVPMVIKKLRR